MISLALMGDTLCRARDGGDPFSGVRAGLSGVDFRVLNLETALSVLGTDGLAIVPADSGIKAMIFTGTPEKYTLHLSGGFEALFNQRPQAEMKIFRQRQVQANQVLR